MSTPSNFTLDLQSNEQYERNTRGGLLGLPLDTTMLFSNRLVRIWNDARERMSYVRLTFSEETKIFSKYIVILDRMERLKSYSAYSVASHR